MGKGLKEKFASFSIVFLLWESIATSDVKIVLPYEMKEYLQKCQNKCVTKDICMNCFQCQLRMT